jgi:hypothetical protein
MHLYRLPSPKPSWQNLGDLRPIFEVWIYGSKVEYMPSKWKPEFNPRHHTHTHTPHRTYF